jgi:hypothetical protein
MAETRPVYQTPDLIITDVAAATFLATRHRPLFVYQSDGGTQVFHFPIDAAASLTEWQRATDILRAELERDRRARRSARGPR